MGILDEIFKAFILTGTIQGIVTGFLLFNASWNRPSNRLLALLIWVMSLAGLDLYIDDFTGWVYSNTTISIIHAIVPIVLPMLIGPLVFFYVRTALDPGFNITKKQRVHFYPVIIDLVPGLTGLIFFVGVITKFLYPNAEPWGNFIDKYNTYADIPRWLSITLYIWYSGKYVARWKTSNNIADSSIASIVKWLQLFIRVFIIFQAIWFIYLVPYVIPRYNQWMLDTFNWYPVFIPLSILIYWLGIKGYLFGYSIHLTDKKKRPAGSLEPEIVQQATGVLAKAMELDKLYLDPLLTINQLSVRAGISARILSAVLNQHIGKGFNEYVNEYRVKEVKERLLRPDLNHLTISGIAFECGFNSQATFQRIFKQQTGMSPSEFLKNISRS